ncbi:MAG: YIP1 family protein [Casimicrobiaceae bacterium]|nr:YIP1 family protein [Casimicrobiaceae bacterium]MDW8311506.1 Yip1 family protein [Burkholderiales bacterium]
MDFKPLFERVKNILITPQTEWPKIAGESETVASLYKRYILILAAIPALAIVIGSLGYGLPFAVVGYLVTLALIYLVSLIANALAPSFDGQKDPIAALKVVTYSSTPGWVGGIFNVIPIVGSLLAFLAGLYGIYLLYLGLPVLMKNPPEKSLGYTALVVVCYIALSILFMVVLMAGVLGAVGVGGLLMGRW